jgi:membrane protein DedA with SNARE-associated domain
MSVLDTLQDSLQVDSAISYLIAIVVPALDAVFPALPGETAVIALGVTTAGSTDPRIALLVACAAAGAFLGDNLCYLLGRRFGPAVQRRFFATPRGAATRAWAQRSLERYGMQLIIVCRFIPGGRTAVTLTCGIIGYPRRRFVAATAVAAAIWALYAFFIGRLGGRAFEDNIWAGLGIALGASLVLSGAVEVLRRLYGRWSRRHAGQVEPDHPGQDEGDGDELHDGDRVAEPDHPEGRRPGGADPGPHGVGGPYVQVAQREGEQPEAGQRAQREADGRPELREPVALLQEDREAGLE